MIGALLRHTIEIVNDAIVPPGTLDPDGEDRGHPARAEEVVATVTGLVQPRRAREQPNVASVGAVRTQYRVYLDAAAIGVVDVDHRLRKSGTVDPDLNADYRITGIANAAGHGHHVEVDAEIIEP